MFYVRQKLVQGAGGIGTLAPARPAGIHDTHPHTMKLFLLY